VIYISIGSNQGDRLANLNTAVDLIKDYFTDFQISIILETVAIVPPGSPKTWNKPYLNMVVRGRSHMTAEQLLKALGDIENTMGRPAAHEKWSPRVMDLDILLFYDQIINLPNLVIPHPEIFNRNFLVHLVALLDPQYIYNINDDSKHYGKTFGEIAYNLGVVKESFIQSLALKPEFVGVVNITPDSFSDGGMYLDPQTTLNKAKELLVDGASVIEFGPQSTRPNNDMMVGPEEEWQRLKPVLDYMCSWMDEEDCQYRISIDSFVPETIVRAIDNYPVSWINDVKGGLSDDVLQHIAKSGCKFVAMHSVSVPPNNNDIIGFDKDPIETICDWAKALLDRLDYCGFTREQVILDPGIGFGKSAYQNLFLLRHVQKLKIFGRKILVGHSRKSFINSFSKVTALERDLETIAIADRLYSCGVDYLRVHNVKDHQRFFVAKQLCQSPK
jgi:2-amino-4-hydroxy-6-hydroxymethyldihydropteridine diphosphokinase/dihydropteroate synthase